MSVYSENISEMPKTPPDSTELVDWWRCWPQARPELLDFWARGGYVSRIVHRRSSGNASITIATEFVDEIEHALKRMILLGVDVDLVWTGSMTPPVFNIAPLDIEYEGPGGWGYSVAAADEVSDGKTDRKWAPAMGWAQLVPESVTDMLAEQCSGLIGSGRLFLAPAELVGLSRNAKRSPSPKFETFTASQTAFDIERQIQIIEELELPYLEGMSISDMVRFSEDYQDELARFRFLMRDFLADQKDVHRIARELKDSVRELNESASHTKMRNTAIGIGAALGTFNFGLATGLPAQAIGAGFVAHAALQWWIEKTISKNSARVNRAWPVWKLGRGKKRMRSQDRRQLGSVNPQPPDKTALWHWLAPPEPGWSIPTAYRG